MRQVEKNAFAGNAFRPKVAAPALSEVSKAAKLLEQSRSGVGRQLSQMLDTQSCLTKTPKKMPAKLAWTKEQTRFITVG